jgi:hypothetical protein
MGEREDGDLCPIVQLEWDRGHDRFTAIVRAESGAGVIVARMHDLRVLPGLMWIPADEVLALDDLDEDVAERRVADLRGDRRLPIDPQLTVLPSLLRHLEAVSPLLAVSLRRTGSDEALVGQLSSVGPDELVLDEVDTGGRFTGHELAVAFDDLLSIEWANDYLDGLADLLAADRSDRSPPA